MDAYPSAVIYERLNRIGNELSELRRAIYRGELAKKNRGNYVKDYSDS